jgi:hypothetical protein
LAQGVNYVMALHICYVGAEGAGKHPVLGSGRRIER